MKQIRLFPVFIWLALVLGIVGGAALVSAQGGLDVVTTRNANMRTAPDAAADLVTIVRAGTNLRLDGRNDNGNWVRGITPTGLIGWVSSGTVSINITQLTGLPVVRVDSPFNLSAPAAGGGATVTASSGTGGTGTSVSATARVNIRSGPGTSFRRLGGLEVNGPFNVDGRDSSGGWVRGINSGGIVGWVSSAYLSITANQLNALPVVGNNTPFNLAAPGGGVVAGAPPASGPVTAIASTSPVRGFSYGGHVQAFSDFAADWMRRAGMTWVKKQWRYFDGQNPNDVAGTIANAHARGFRILLGVVGQSPNDINSPGYFERYASFVAGVAALGADAIEVWNEPNLPHEWPVGSINPASYTQLLRVSFNAIRAANPNTLVISAAPAPTGFFGGCSPSGCDDNAYLAGMAAAGAVNFMDCIGIHYNEGILPPTATSGDPRGNSGHYTRYLRPMMDVYYNAFRGARPLCFTEMGYLSPEGYGPLSANFAWAANVTVAQQAAWLAQAIDIIRRSGRARLVIIWNVDFTNYGDDPMAGYAMIRPGGGCPACEALGR